MTEGYVKGRIEQGISTIEFFHPKGNSMSAELLYALAAEIRAAAANAGVRVILLQSGGTGPFCAGASFDELKAVKNVQAGIEFFSGFAQAILAMVRAPQCVIARVQGKAAGGGVGLAAAADIAYAATGADVRLSELLIGLGPFTIGPAVERKIGAAAFGDLAFTADWRSAEWARDRGLYQNVYHSVSDLDAAAAALAKKVAGFSAPAVRRLKQTVWQDTEGWEQVLAERARISAELLMTPEAQKAVQAAAQK